MFHTFMSKLWNASPKSIYNRLFKPVTQNRANFIPDLPFKADEAEFVRLNSVPRYTSTSTELMGKKLQLVDAYSYLHMCDEIFTRKNYEFEASRKDPLIIDCGANIGLSIIYFKTLYPECRIIAFEADGRIFDALQQNIESFGFNNVELHNKAVWTEESELQFQVEGSWGGRLVNAGEEGQIIKVEAVRLKDFLINQKVDLLKIDVEGAEYDILLDCADALSEVENLCFEYHSHAGQRQTLQELLEIVQKSGFRYHIKEASTRNLPFIDRVTDGMDLQLDIFAFRL